MNTPSNSPSGSLGFRAAVAVLLMLGFYALALGLAGGLLWLIYADVVLGHRLHIKLVVVCAVAAFAILKGCLFVSDTWEAPGPEITREQHPRLFAFIDEIARAMGARLPQNVYLVPDVNAFVAEVGGFMGMFGTRRVMGIGVGMLNTDSISQLRATLAHEFGHFQGGDTRLGAFLYRTRGSIGRVIGALGDSLLSKPFEWYGALFMRLTQAIARRQELAADACSVTVAGKKAHIEGLKRESVAGTMFRRFLDGEVTPVLQEERRPHNLFDGFRTYLQNLGADGVLTKVEDALGQEETDPYDSHPALTDRLAFAESLPESVHPDEPALSRTLLEKPDAVEADVSRSMLSNAAQDYKAVAWEEIPQLIYATRHGESALELDKVLGTSDATLAAMLVRLEKGDNVALARELAPHAFQDVDRDGEMERAQEVVAHFCSARINKALASKEGWTWRADPGRAVCVAGPDGQVVDSGLLMKAALESGAGLASLRQKLVELQVA